MISVIAPPGCYGTYIARCLHHYTSPIENCYFDFDHHGSSHVFKKIPNNVATSRLMHWESVKLDEINKDSTIIVRDDSNHLLDYFDNQYYKNMQGNLLEFLAGTFDNDVIQQDLLRWNYQEPINENTPMWILREYLSFNLVETLKNGYNNKSYLFLPHAYNFCCEDMWTSRMWDIVNILADALNKKVYASKQHVENNHQNFLNRQTYHNIQLRCDQYVFDIVNQVSSMSPCVSLFDEAYVQHQLRNYGYEIHCNNLDIFPKTSIEMNKYIFKI